MTEKGLSVVLSKAKSEVMTYDFWGHNNEKEGRRELG
jgi:hypothetical protein